MQAGRGRASAPGMSMPCQPGNYPTSLDAIWLPVNEAEIQQSGRDAALEDVRDGCPATSLRGELGQTHCSVR